jgi:hypothetical protein
MEYRNLDGLNQSLLKKILVSPSAFIRQRDKQGDSDEDHFVFGSLVDDMLLSNIELQDKYYIMEETPLSDVLKSITRYVFDYSETLETIPAWDTLENAMLLACDEYEYQGRWKAETRVDKIKKECKPYFLSLRKSKGKRIVSEEDYNKAVICVASLKADPFTSIYFSKGKEIETITHKVITFEYRGLQFKGELDKVFIDHKNKTITPIDYKTTGTSVYSFQYDFWKFRYDFQAAVYYYGISVDPEMKKLVEAGYKILHFRYIVVEKEMFNPPMIFKVTNKVTNIGFKGGTLSSGKTLEGFMQAVERYLFHAEEDKWDYPMEYYKNNYLEIKE